ncbi:glycerophosphodiester phosphodiesterase [Pontiella sulfatireligans]|uniref:Glycerophosphodiester phosphodiesterase n=1 Tax=Pontiella sulfatireligans TaxID=2750658 RepID=A0A6C2UP14_9BACT|nr:glycerophosphodiester phosphodiesterase [Pontiella sulfatireligans]VGO21011.1 Glycerophosphodiester phosphodiesterase [Pontiella sulfatireligans]
MNHAAEIIAHRGASYDAPENTMESFELGLAQGADAIECDVHLTQDGQLVVIHDPTVQRTAGVNKAVKDMTLAELQALDAGSWKSPDWRDARIPALAEVLDLLPTDRRIFIEIKAGPPAVAPLQKVIAASALQPSQMVLMEFDLETVIAMKENFPAIEVLWLNKLPRLQVPWRKKRALHQILSTTRQRGLNGVNLQNTPLLNAALIRACREHGLGCYCWTVDDPRRAAALAKNGINGIATNRPGWMRKQLNATGAPRS